MSTWYFACGCAEFVQLDWLDEKTPEDMAFDLVGRLLPDIATQGENLDTLLHYMEELLPEQVSQLGHCAARLLVPWWRCSSDVECSKLLTVGTS